MKSPIKTGDIVQDGEGKRYVVKSIDMTSTSVILSLNPIRDVPVLAHIEDVELADRSEASRRIKSVLGEID